MKNKVIFELDQFDRIFPFYIKFNEELIIESIGGTLEKLYPGISGGHFNNHLTIIRPQISIPTFEDIRFLINQMVVIECKNDQKTTLRGQFEWIANTDHLFFIGSPWFGSMEQVIENKLSIHDFALHDPMIDLLHVLKSQEITTDDLKHLLETVNKQKNELKKAAKRYKDVIENSLALITTHDLDGNFITVNPMVGKTYGYNDEDLIGKKMSDFIPESDKSFFYEEYLTRIKENKQDGGIFRLKHKNGNIIHTLYNNYLKEETGKDPYVIGFGIDITERIRAEQKLLVAKKQTEELAKAKENFLTNMSHEIRTPMNAIVGMSNQLSKTSLSEQQKFYLNTIHTAADNLLVIVNDILDLSKIEAGKLSIETIAFEFKSVVEDAIQVLKHKSEEKGILLTFSNCDPLISPVLIGDPHRLSQVLLNLISNAVKFTDEGMVDVTCKVLNETESAQTICIGVRDTGIGMDEYFVKNLFQKFNQEDVSVSRRFGGTGLGLAITKQLIQLMGGSIDVSSQKNVGTEITINIEFKKGMLSQLESVNESHVDTKVLQGKKILVVDDNDMNRLVASTVIQNFHAEVREAKNGQEAVTLVAEEKPALVLMDLQMPVMNGLEATKMIRSKAIDIPIIALTANAIKGENEKCFEAGMNDYLSKPYKEEELLQIIVKWLDQERSGGEESTGIDISKIEKDEQLYDLTGLIDISRGNQAFIDKMVKLFCDQAPKDIQQMTEAFSVNDLQRMGRIAHKLKASIDNLRIASIREEIRIIEKADKLNLPSNSVSEALQKIKDVINLVIDDMSSL